MMSTSSSICGKHRSKTTSPDVGFSLSKRTKTGNSKNAKACSKARWVLGGFQDREKDSVQKDSPTSTRPGLRLACQAIASNGWRFGHVDLKTAFLQGE
eukprot:5596535-Amphidinium_carterae.1